MPGPDMFEFDVELEIKVEVEEFPIENEGEVSVKLGSSSRTRAMVRAIAGGDRVWVALLHKSCKRKRIRRCTGCSIREMWVAL